MSAACVGQVRPLTPAHGPFTLNSLACSVGRNMFILDAGTEIEWDPVVMAEDFEHKNVALVAVIIGAVILLLGFTGLVINLS